MEYAAIYKLLKDALDRRQDSCVLPELGVELLRKTFHSAAVNVLPGAAGYTCSEHQASFAQDGHTGAPVAGGPLAAPDHEISSNEQFYYYLLKDAAQAQAEDVIILFHGLNEKRWDKYLPWAYRLVRKTGKAVILFPIAFHMDRAPALWSDVKQMHGVAQQRAAGIVNNAKSSFVNAAISARLEANPQRIFWSGFQTYIDVSMLLQHIRKGNLQEIAAGAGIDLFGYSIGAYFALILLMANPHGLLGGSRLFIFCGGATLDRMYPISKYILDARSSIALQAYFAAQVHINFAAEERLAHYLDAAHEESYFKAMLQYNHFKAMRENRLAELAQRVQAVCLKQDDVIPPVEVMNTLQGDYREIPIPVTVLDFHFPYTHVTPFPLVKKHQQAVTAAYESVLDRAISFLD